jgi:release factor glutamine methyltransferase
VVTQHTAGELLAASGLPALEARALLAHQLGIPRDRLIAGPDQRIAEADARRFAELVQRRQRGEPLAYLLGEKEFYGRMFKVSSAVLIPRPETELLVDIALSADVSDTAHVLDLGTGSGCLALTLALERPAWHITATDVSQDALELARTNATTLKVSNVAFRHGSWFSAVSGQSFDLIVSNPPYVAVGDSHLDALRFEPLQALVSEGNGLTCLQQIIEGAPGYLASGGILALEHGYEQAEAVCALFGSGSWRDIRTHTDFAGVERVTMARAI